MFFIKNAFVIAPLALSIGMAALGFGTSTRTISNANWSTFCNTVGEVRIALYEKAVTTKGEEAAAGMTRTDAQVYNFVAKGGNFLDRKSEETTYQWISRAQGNTLACTQITEDVIENALGLKNLNKVKVNTEKATGVTASYFVTGSGDVFVWPPFEHDNELYVNEETQITKADGTPIKADSKDAAKIYKDGYTFKVGTVNITVSNKESLPAFDIQNTTPEALAKMPAIAYKDGANATSPVGLENIPFEGSYYENYLNNRGPHIMYKGYWERTNESQQLKKLHDAVYEFNEKRYDLLENLSEKSNSYALYMIPDSAFYQALANGMIDSEGKIQGETRDLPGIVKMNKTVVKNVFGIELPEIETEMPNGKKTNVDFYITDRMIFVWPPVKVDEEYYIDNNYILVKGNDKPITTADKEDVNAMFYGDFSFEIPSWRENRIVQISNGKVVCE